MAKRFIDTGIFSDSWFSELSANNKLFYIYLFTQCDHAGVIDLNPKYAEFETGIKGLAKSLETVKGELGNRLVSLRDNYYVLPKFLKFQYPKGLSPNVKAQLSVINRLNEFDLDLNSLETLTKQLRESSLTPQDIDKDKDKDKDKGVLRGKKFQPPTYEEYFQYCKKEGFSNIAERSFKGYAENNWHDSHGNAVKNWKSKLQMVWFNDRNKDQHQPEEVKIYPI